MKKLALPNPTKLTFAGMSQASEILMESSRNSAKREVAEMVTSTCWTYFGKFLHRCIVQLPTENQQMRCNLFVGRLAGNLGRIWTKLGFVSGLTEGGIISYKRAESSYP